MAERRDSEVSLPTFDEFMAREAGPANSYVREPGFESLYVRKSWRLVDVAWHQTVDIANVSVEEGRRGTGVFTRFVERVSSEYPGWAVYVESVLEERFARKLKKMGFKKVGTWDPPCFFFFRAGRKPEAS